MDARPFKETNPQKAVWGPVFLKCVLEAKFQESTGCIKIRSQRLNERYTPERVGCFCDLCLPSTYQVAFLLCQHCGNTVQQTRWLMQQSQWLVFSPGATSGPPSFLSLWLFFVQEHLWSLCVQIPSLKTPFICLSFALITSLNTLLRTQPHCELLKVGLLHEFGKDVIQLIAGNSPTQVLAGRLERGLIRAMLEMANWRKLIAASSHMQRPNVWLL